jgi:outer membrane protein TolC
MLVRRSCRLLAGVCAAVWLCCGQTAVLSLDEAIRLAAKQNQQIQITTLEVNKAAEQTSQLKTQRLPVLKIYTNLGVSLIPIDLTVPRGTLGVYPSTGPIPDRDASIRTPRRLTGFLYGSASQPLSQLYKISLALKEAHIGEQAAREKLRQQTQQTTQQVKQAFYQLTETQSQIASAQTGVKYLEELAAFTERNLAQETVLKADSLDVKAKLAQQRYQLLTLEDNLATQKEAFNYLLGRDLRTEFTVQAEPLPSEEETNLAAAQKKALEQRPEMRQAQLQTQKAALDVRRQRAEYLPDVSLHFSYFSFANVNFFPQNVATAGLLIDWQPFDWGFKKHKIRELRSSQKQASLAEHDAGQQILRDVNASFRKLRETRALLGVTTAAQDAEREKLRVLLDRYKQKSALLTDVLGQQNSLAQADTQYQQALSAFWTAKAAFERALGE